MSNEMKPITLGLIALACALAGPRRACAQATCPPELAVEQKAVAPESGWTVTYSPYQTAIAGVTIFDGPPSEQASLVPDNQKTTADTVIQTWQLAGSGRGYWLQCEYANTTAQLYRGLPASVTRCEVSYARNLHFGGAGRPVVKSVNCK